MRGFAKKTLAVVLTLTLLVPCLLHSAEAVSAPKRQIHVVYDDSSSMIISDQTGEKVDTWCQAKYAIEVFAALLGENDTMNVYYMSDFDSNANAAPKLQLSGQNSQSSNVDSIHNLVTPAGNTPFSSVRKAYNDLKGVNADEKWLVVLTDGEFQGIDDIDGFFEKKDSDIQVMYLGMGAAAGAIKANADKGIYFEKAATSKEILKKVTEISTRIFNSHRLEVSASTKTFSFDVPMAQLVIFAQGANVSVGDIADENGKSYKASSVPVLVQYSEKPATNYNDFILDKNLKGVLLSFQDDFPASKYTLDVSGADTIEIYYKPNVEIAAYLTDISGNSVTNLSNLEAGTYTIEFGLVKAGTNEPIGHSSLIGDIQYSATVTNNGVTHEKTYDSGDEIYLEEGALSIDAEAVFLEYHTVTTHLDYDIFENKEVGFTICDDPTYIVTKDGINKETPIQVRVSLNGEDMTEEQWAMMGLPEVVPNEGQGSLYDSFTVEKSEECGVLLLYPNLVSDNLLSIKSYGDAAYTIAYQERHGEAQWTGSGDGVMHVQDQRSLLEKIMPHLPRLIGMLAAFLLIIGYLPPFKRYLPRTLKSRPDILCVPTKLGKQRTHYKGSVEKDLFSTLLPYKAQTGTIRYTPQGTSGFPKMKIKALKGRQMKLMNMRDYVKKTNITFDGTPITVDMKSFRCGAGVDIVAKGKDWTYMCCPNQTAE